MTQLALTLAFASLSMLALAWLIGVQGLHGLISNYRRHPERFPDAAGLGRWMGWTLAAGGLAMGLLALLLAGGLLPLPAAGAAAGVTGAIVAALALAGVARFRRLPPPNAGPRRR